MVITMYYGLIVLAALLFSSQFMFTEGCQRENGSGWSVSVKLSFYTALLSIPVVFLMNGLTNGFPDPILQFSWFSFGIAVVQSISNLVLNYFTIKTFAYANLSVYTVFSMVGGMVLPFLYGVAVRGDALNILKIVCFVLILFSVLMMYEKGKTPKKAFIYYIGVFILNGMSGVYASLHQSRPELCVDSGSFMILGKLITIVFCLILMIKTRDRKVNGKTIAYTVGSASFNSIANLFLLIALADNHVLTSVQYPLVTGGTIVFSLVIDLIRGRKVSKKEMVSAGIALVASCLMAL